MKPYCWNFYAIFIIYMIVNLNWRTVNVNSFKRAKNSFICEHLLYPI